MRIPEAHYAEIKSLDRAQRQYVVDKWVERTFGEEGHHKQERLARLLEEVIELCQAEDFDQALIARIVVSVYGRPKGEPSAEVGGIGTTLLAYCQVAGLDADVCEASELARIQSVPTAKFRERNAEKREAGLCPSPYTLCGITDPIQPWSSGHAQTFVHTLNQYVAVDTTPNIWRLADFSSNHLALDKGILLRNVPLDLLATEGSAAAFPASIPMGLTRGGFQLDFLKAPGGGGSVYLKTMLLDQNRESVIKLLTDSHRALQNTDLFNIYPGCGFGGVAIPVDNVCLAVTVSGCAEPLVYALVNPKWGDRRVLFQDKSEAAAELCFEVNKSDFFVISPKGEIKNG